MTQTVLLCHEAKQAGHNEERKKLAVDIGDNLVNPEEVNDTGIDAPAN